MNEKLPLDPRNFRPHFIQEKQNAEIAIDEGMRTCVGFKEDGSVCGIELPRGLRYYCSGGCMRRARERGDYRHD
jgi:hypothetical protein